MQPYSNSIISNTTVIAKHGDDYTDLTEHQIYSERPMATPLQPWMTTNNTPDENHHSSYAQMYSSNHGPFLSSAPSSSPNIPTAYAPSIHHSSYPPPLVGGSASILPPFSPGRQRDAIHVNSENFMLSNNHHGEYQHTQMANTGLPAFNPHEQTYSPSPSPPQRYRNNSILSDSSNPACSPHQDEEEDRYSRQKTGKTPVKKRERALEKNRQAALRCRQRKKEWLNQLQSNVDILTKENRTLEQQSIALREEILNLKTVLLAHRDCSHAHITAKSINYDHLLYRPLAKSAATVMTPPSSL